MCSRFPELASALVCALFCLGCHTKTPAERASASERVLRVCSDPNNLPFSNNKTEGFENRIAELLARDMHARIEYTWFAQRRGFIRNTLNAGQCDLVMGVPSDFDLVATTRPYYRSTYVFVTRTDAKEQITSMDDTALKRLNIGVHLIGDDYANPPPAHALSYRKITRNVIGYTLYGDYSQPNPPARLIEAVATRAVDVAIVWGPLGGYFGSRQSPQLRVTPIIPENDSSGLPFAFDIALGVRKADKVFRDELDGVLRRRESEIRGILEEFGVPLKPLVQRAAATSAPR
jgi:quinoprotein dehydrogenase-associated probable ABC transporter substrate-binding protein